MNGNGFDLDAIQVRKPCEVPWDSMAGDDHKRFCSLCKLHVYNLEAMTRAEVESHLLGEGRRCIRMTRRADGTVVTRDCGAVRRERKMRRGAAALVFILACFTAGGMGFVFRPQAEGLRRACRQIRASRLHRFTVVRALVNTVDPQPQCVIMGAMF